MSGELEAAGALATAGLAAGAIEGREAHGQGDGACLNCGAKLEGAYCAQCGQASHPHRTLTHVFEEFLHGIIHFDTKAWRTLPMLMFRPGTLTRNYVYGKRARYISPLALFLFTVFFMFAVFAFAGMNAPVNVNESTSVAEAREDLAEARERLSEARGHIAEIEAGNVEDPPGAEGLTLDLANQALQRAEAAVARREAALQRAEAREAEAAPEGADVVDAESGAVVAPVQVGASTAANEAAPEAGPEVVVTDDGVTVARDDGTTWQDVARDIAEQDDFVVVHGWDSLNYKVREKLRNPDLAAYKIQQAAYKFSFLLIPISLPFIALLFLWKRGVTFYDHVVFALYSLSFVSILFVTLVLTAGAPFVGWVAPILATFGIPVHMYFHLKGAYALGWFSALWRTFFMLIFALISLVVFLIAIVILGLTG